MHNGNPRKKEKGVETIFEEIRAEKFPDMIEDMNIYIQGTQQTEQNKFKEIRAKTYYSKTVK